MDLNLELVTAPAAEPVSRSDVKSHCRISGSDDDTYLDALIETARDQAEKFMARRLITQTWTWWLDGWPGSPGGDEWFDGVRQTAVSEVYGRARALEIPYAAPLQSITYLKTYDDQDNATTYSSDNYFVDANSQTSYGRLVLRNGVAGPSPTRSAKGIEIKHVCGFGDSDTDVPPPIRMGIKMLVAYMFEFRGDDVEVAGQKSGAHGIWMPYRMEPMI